MLQSGDSAPNIKPILAETRNAPRTDPNWPVLTYLIGEAYLKRNDIGQARATFRDLAVWAASDQSALPQKERWGGSGLAAVGLWRWLKILDEHGGTPEEVDQALKVAVELQETRLFGGMVRSGLLPALPLIEEDVARRLAHVAWKAGRQEAMGLFLDFLSIDSTGEFDAIDKQIENKMIEEGLATPERLDLFRYQRQLGLVTIESRKERAAEKLGQLWENQNAPAEVRARAGYEWSNFYRRSKSRKNDVIARLTSAFELEKGSGTTAEKALYLRGVVQNSVGLKNPDAFFTDMHQLLDLFPDSQLADDALYQMATEHLYGKQPDPDRAFSDFDKLRKFEGENDWLDSAYFLAAIGHVERGKDSDLKAADGLLADYVDRFPDGVFRQRCLFWRGRISEQNNDLHAAQSFFRQVVEETPYYYYGLRAGMHLDYGPNAVSMALPREDSKTWSRLREAYQDSSTETELVGHTPYHERLRTAGRNGLYKELLLIVDSIGKRFHNRLDNIPLQQLDDENLIPAVALQLSLRQDALAARDSVLTTDNQLRLAGFLGRKCGDWPSAIAMTNVRGRTSRRHITELQNDPRFLATVYPDVDALGTLKEAIASRKLSESLMYGVIRQESAYYPGAISSVGALGLFQIMPDTFKGRPECWQPGTAGRKPTPASYLFDPVRNTMFWSCWVRKEFDPETRDGIVLMLAKHHAGTGTLRSWMETWKERDIERDLELQIDTYRFPATSLFVRQVITDVAIAEAGGFFETGSGGRDNQ